MKIHVLYVLAAFGLLASLADGISAATLPAGFEETAVANVTETPTAMEFSPDGKLFIAQQVGYLSVWKDGVELASNFFSPAPLLVQASTERGLLGVAFDPNYASNRFIYVYYTTTASDGHNRVSRFTSNSSGNQVVAGSEFIVWEGDSHSTSIHNGGAIHFGPDGKLYIGTGDNADGANSQSLASQHGKLLRVNPDGSIPLDNPFYDSTGPNKDTIWALGLRNPFTFAFQPGTGRLFINDVGQGAWEEINDGGGLPSGRGKNYGWPGTEGDFNPTANPGFTRPFYAYSHDSQVTTPSGGVITGGAFYNPATNTFGSAYQGDYFFADMGGAWIYRIDSNTKQLTQFASNVPGAVDLKVTDDGSLYYLSYYLRKVFRVANAAAAVPTISQQPANQTVGAGAQVTFSVDSAGAQSFQWQRSDDDGAHWTNVNGATSKTLTFVTALGDDGALFRAKATNSLGTATSNPAKLTVIDNALPNPPVITITSGVEGDGKYTAGQQVRFTGTATDPEDGDLGASAFTWKISFLTATDQGDEDHDGLPGVTSPVETFSGTKSGGMVPATSGTYAFPDVAYAITLKVTDSLGFSSSNSVVISPKTTSVTLVSTPIAVPFTLDGRTVPSPTTFLSVRGFYHSATVPVSVEQSGTNYNLSGWNGLIGGSNTITFSPSGTAVTYTAGYVPASLPLPWSPANVGAVGTPGSVIYNSGTFSTNGAGFIKGKADAFYFVSQTRTGDCSITARVAGLPLESRRDEDALAGVMIRSSLVAGSPHMFVGLRAKGAMQVISRNVGNARSDAGNTGRGSAPYWVRVTRVGNVLTAYTSPDGVNWKSVRSKNTITLKSPLYLGLAVCSDEAGLQSAVFDNVTVTP